MKNLLFGIIGGIGNIVPGLSGSGLLVILGIYESCINAISNIFKNFKKNFLYLLPIGIGIVIGTFTFSNIIGYFIKKYAMGTSIVFVGFLMGTIPTLFKEATKKDFKWCYLISFLIAFTIGVLMLFWRNNNYFFNNNINANFFNLILVGSLISLSTIIPGISSTVLLSMIGMYNIYIDAISTLNISILIPIFIGFAISTFFISKIINYLLKNYYGYTYFAIIGFTIATIPALVNTKLIFNTEFVISLIMSLLAGIITIFIFKKEEKYN